jgi:hypothetical protein
MLETPVTRPSLKRKAYGSPREQTPKRLASVDATRVSGHILSTPGPPAPIHPNHQAPAPTTAILPLPRLDTQHVNIQPKPPALGHAGAATPTGPPTPSSNRNPPGTRRRGRPSRADQARQFRPVLPQTLSPLAPRTPILERGEDIPRRPSPSVLATPVPPAPGSHDPAMRRGRPPMAEKTKSASDTEAPG